jgi:mono/diheme cytochrome c family protein
MMKPWSWMLAGCLMTGSSPVVAQPDAAALIARGQVVYREQKCQTCHSVAGVGNRRSPLDGVGGRLDEKALRNWVVAPQTMNPKVRKRAYDKLPKDDLDALVAYLRSLRS